MTFRKYIGILTSSLSVLFSFRKAALLNEIEEGRGDKNCNNRDLLSGELASPQHLSRPIATKQSLAPREFALGVGALEQLLRIGEHGTWWQRHFCAYLT